MLMVTGFLPKSITKPEQAIAIMMKGKEIGMPPMQSLQQIHIINGMTCLSAEGMLGQVLRHYPSAKIDYIQNDDVCCTIEVTRPGNVPNRFSFSYADAEKAKLTGKDNWNKFRRAMLRSRCVSEMCRSLFPDAIQGCSYTPEEAHDSIEETPVKVRQTEVRQAPVVMSKEIRVAKMTDSFYALGVSSADLEEFLGKKLDECTDEDLTTMLSVFNDLKAGKMDREDMLEFAKKPEVIDEIK